MIENIKYLQKKGLGRQTPNTLMYYYDLYMNYNHYIDIGTTKMQAYTNVSEDSNCSERTVIRAIEIWEDLTK